MTYWRSFWLLILLILVVRDGIQIIARWWSLTLDSNSSFATVIFTQLLCTSVYFLFSGDICSAYFRGLLGLNMWENLLNFKFYVFSFRGEGRERGRETSMWERHRLVASCTSPGDQTPQLRLVLWPVIKPGDLSLCRMTLNPRRHTLRAIC